MGATNILVKVADFVFDGFTSSEFPLGDGHSSMTLLYQRVYSKRYEEVGDARARLYYNLVVLFRLLWHHRSLEGTPNFWECIYRDFGAKSGKPREFQRVTTHYVAARKKFQQRHGPKEESTSTLTRLVDQWCSRPKISADVAHVVNKALEIYSHKAQSSWEVVLNDPRLHERLVFSKDLNWPVITPSFLDKLQLPPVRAGDGRALGEAGRQDLASTTNLKSEPGRLTPPLELRLHREEKKVRGSDGPHRSGREDGGSKNSDKKEQLFATIAQGKRPAPQHPELSPFAKRRLITSMAKTQLNPEGVGGSANGESLRQAHGRGVGAGDIAMQPQGSQNAKGSRPDIVRPFPELQSLQEMITSAASNPLANGGFETMARPSSVPDKRTALSWDAVPVAEEPSSYVNPPAVDAYGNPILLIDVPATLFEFSRRIENLERMAEGQARVSGALSALSWRVTKLEKFAEEETEDTAAVSSLTSRITDLEETAEDREQLSATISATATALTNTVEALEKKLGEAIEARAEAATLTLKITELEQLMCDRGEALARKFKHFEESAESRAANQAGKTEVLELKVRRLWKILEGQGLTEAGEVME